MRLHHDLFLIPSVTAIYNMIALIVVVHIGALLQRRLFLGQTPRDVDSDPLLELNKDHSN